MAIKEDPNKNIVLIGMMGAGKSYIGGKLSKLLVHFDYVDIDAQIEHEQSEKISDIFEKHGESFFRKLEEDMIAKYSAKCNCIISTGGGAFENPNNIDNLKKNGVVFYLKASGKELFSRIKSEKHRPLLGRDFSEKKLESILKKREKNYLKADFVIDTEQKRAYTILNDILKEYENYVK